MHHHFPSFSRIGQHRNDVRYLAVISSSHLHQFLTALGIMEATNPSKLFSVEGMVVCITGGGTGAYGHVNRTHLSVRSDIIGRHRTNDDQGVCH